MMAGMETRNEALTRAIEVAGGLGKLATALGITAQAVSQWEQAPPLRCRQIEELTGVSRHELRPDVFGTSGRTDARERRRAGRTAA